MATKRFKRPSSARRNIKQECFSSYVSCNRLRNVQSLLNTYQQGDASAPEVILCVLGIDSKYNEGSLELVNYLLFNFFASRKNELEKSGFAEEVIDDMMFVIRASSVDIYCNPINYSYLLPYVAHWRNMHFHCLKDDVYEDDEEKAEEFKIQSLIAMTDGCKKIGIPYSATGQHTTEPFDVMAVEKWPIVQAFAIDGIGGYNGCFFSMKYTLIDMSSCVQSLYNLMDPVALEAMVTEQLPLFERQWRALLSNVDVDVPNQCSKITEGKVSEPLQSYFNHGRLGSAKGSRSTPSTREPFVLFGTHTRREYMERSEKASMSSTAQLADVATPGGAPTAQHMICQAVSPRGPICCRRTYFFTHAVLPCPLSKSENDEFLPNFEKSDVRILQLVYQACIDAVVAAIACYAETLSTVTAEGIARQVLVESCDKTRPRIRPRHLVGRESVDFTLHAYNNQNSIVDLEEGVSSHLVNTLAMTVFDIPSVEYPGKSMGSVSYAESFLQSTIHFQMPDERINIDGKAVLLSGHIPRLLTWPCGPEHARVAELATSRSMVAVTAALGRPLVSGETAQIATHSGLFSLDDGQLYLYEQGIVYLHPHQAPIVLPKQELAALHFYDGDSSSVVAVLVLTYRPSVRAHVPVHLRCPSHQLLLAFRPKSKAYKALFSEVLSVWKEEEATPKLSLLDDLPEELQYVHEQLQAVYKLHCLANLTPLQHAKTKLPELNSFMSHFECGSLSSQPLPSKHLPVAIGRDWDAGYFGDSQEQLLLTVLTGPPGGGKDAVCHSVSKLADWATLRQPDEAADNFHPALLHASLSSVWASNKRKTATNGELKVRGLLVVPGLTNTVDVLQAIVTHPDRELAAKIRIGAVTVCIDPDGAFMSDHFLLPSLLDQCAQGWLNNVVFSTATSNKHTNLDLLQSMIRAINSDVALLLANKGEVTREVSNPPLTFERSTDLDMILAESAFDDPALMRARYLSCPGWQYGLFDTGFVRPVMDETSICFSKPLDKTRFLHKLKGIRASLAKKYPYTGNIYHIRGKVTFTESSSQAYVIHYTSLSDHLALSVHSSQQLNGTTPSASIASSFMAFYGSNIEESKLKDWLRACAPPKPERRLKRTIASLNKTEINRLHKAHHLDTLPEGWFYNGSKFVSMTGDKSDTHPNLEQFITDYLAQVNMEVDIFNARIDRQDYHDLFE